MPRCDSWLRHSPRSPIPRSDARPTRGAKTRPCWRSGAVCREMRPSRRSGMQAQATDGSCGRSASPSSRSRPGCAVALAATSRRPPLRMRVRPESAQVAASLDDHGRCVRRAPRIGAAPCWRARGPRGRDRCVDARGSASSAWLGFSCGARRSTARRRRRMPSWPASWRSPPRSPGHVTGDTQPRGRPSRHASNGSTPQARNVVITAEQIVSGRVTTTPRIAQRVFDEATLIATRRGAAPAGSTVAVRACWAASRPCRWRPVGGCWLPMRQPLPHRRRLLPRRCTAMRRQTASPSRSASARLRTPDALPRTCAIHSASTWSREAPSRRASRKGRLVFARG